MSAKPNRSGTEALRNVLSFAFGHWRRQPVRAALVAAGMVAATLCELAVPVFAGRLVDAVASDAAARDAALSAVIAAVATMAALNVGSIGLRHLAMMTIIRFTLVGMSAIAAETFARVQRFSTDWHASTFAGSTVRKITRGMWALDLLNDTLLLAFLPAFVVLVGSGVLFALRWPAMGLAVAAGAALYLAVQLFISLRIIAPAAKLSNGWDTRLGGVVADSISCNAVVKGYGGEAREDGRIVGVVARWRRRSDRLWRFATWAGTAQLLNLALLRTLVISAAVALWWHGRATPGDVVFAFTAYAVVDAYLREMAHHIRNLQKSVNDMEEMVAFYAEPLGVADAAGARDLKVEGGGIAFEKVGFHYGAHAEPLFHDLDVTIRPGERIALVGHSGSGKTTFVKLVQRLYDVGAGRVAIDGTDVRSVTQDSLRRQIAIVQQEPILFHRTLAENIAYGRPGATRSEIRAAARLANADGFIERLSKGYDTLVGERGVKLSGGERQRVAIARAFLADAPILILDEATSSLDAESEAAVQEAIGRLMRGRTTIVIAHRLSTVRAMDRLLVFDRGRIVEEGSHDDLMRHEGGVYRRLFERQMAAMADEIAA